MPRNRGNRRELAAGRKACARPSAAFAPGDIQPACVPACPAHRNRKSLLCSALAKAGDSKIKETGENLASSAAHARQSAIVSATPEMTPARASNTAARRRMCAFCAHRRAIGFLACVKSPRYHLPPRRWHTTTPLHHLPYCRRLALRQYPKCRRENISRNIGVAALAEVTSPCARRAREKALVAACRCARPLRGNRELGGRQV